MTKVHKNTAHTAQSGDSASDSMVLRPCCSSYLMPLGSDDEFAILSMGGDGGGDDGDGDVTPLNNGFRDLKIVGEFAEK